MLFGPELDILGLLEERGGEGVLGGPLGQAGIAQIPTPQGGLQPITAATQIRIVDLPGGSWSGEYWDPVSFNFYALNPISGQDCAGPGTIRMYQTTACIQLADLFHAVAAAGGTVISTPSWNAAHPDAPVTCPAGQCKISNQCYPVGQHIQMDATNFCVIQPDCGCCGGTFPCPDASGFQPPAPWPFIKLDATHGIPGVLLDPFAADPCVPTGPTDTVCAWPQKNTFHCTAMPFPSGAQFLVAPSGLPTLAIPATDAVRAAQAKVVQTLLANAQKDLPDIHGMSAHDYYTKKAQAVADGTSYFGGPISYIGEAYLDSYGATAPAGRPPVVNPDNVDGNPGWWTYSQWFAFYGAQTQGWMLLVNIPYFNVSLTFEQMFPFLANPFSFLAHVIAIGVADLVKEIAKLLCSGLGRVATAGAVTAISGAQAAGGALNIANAICGAGGGVCPIGYAYNPTTKICEAQTSPWLYVGVGALVLGLGGAAYYALRPKRKVAA